MEASEALELAWQTWKAIEGRLLDTATGLYGERGPLRRRRWRYEHLWPFAGAWSALCALASLGASGLPSGRLARQLQALEAYRLPGGSSGLSSAAVPPFGPGGDRYFDDNAWIGLALCRQARLTGQAAPLEMAASLAGFVASGWATGDHLAHPGGVRWKEGLGTGGRNTCSNAPAAALGAMLHLLGEVPGQLVFAEQVYAWTREALRTVHGLYADRIAPDGTITSAVLSYNQGAMIGAGVLLHKATGDRRYLEDASRTVTASLARYGDGASLARESPGFVAIYVRNLLFFDSVRPDPAHRQLADAYGERLLGARGGDGLVRPAGGRVSVLLASAALVEVLALLAGAPAWP